MKDSKNTFLKEQTDFIQVDIDHIISTRRQLFHFVPTESNLVMTFRLADGEQVEVPIQDVY